MIKCLLLFVSHYIVYLCLSPPSCFNIHLFSATSCIVLTTIFKPQLKHLHLIKESRISYGNQFPDSPLFLVPDIAFLFRSHDDLWNLLDHPPTPRLLDRSAFGWGQQASWLTPGFLCIASFTRPKDGKCWYQHSNTGLQSLMFPATHSWHLLRMLGTQNKQYRLQHTAKLGRPEGRWWGQYYRDDGVFSSTEPAAATVYCQGKRDAFMGLHLRYCQIIFS